MREYMIDPDETVEQFLSKGNPYSTPVGFDDIANRLSRMFSIKKAHAGLGAVRPFFESQPFTYWSDPQVSVAKGVLDSDPHRSIEAINYWGRELGHAYEMLMLESPAARYDHELSSMRVRDIQLLSTVFLPEYLRLAEHVFKNLLCIYWSIKRKGGVSAKFDLRGGTAMLKSNGLESLCDGFDEGVRNGIAHGQVTYQGQDVCFGIVDRGMRISVHDVFYLYDRLLRSCTGLLLAVMLFGIDYGNEMLGLLITNPIKLQHLISAGSKTPRANDKKERSGRCQWRRSNSSRCLCREHKPGVNIHYRAESLCFSII